MSNQTELQPTESPTEEKAPQTHPARQLLNDAVQYEVDGRTVELRREIVRDVLSVPTSRGNLPSDRDILRFMMLCRSRGLDPWVGDAVLTGFDGKDGPQFQLITTLQALLKRAESHPAYNGMVCGVIIRTAKNDVQERIGEIVLDKAEELIGAWAEVYRGDQDHPTRRTINRAAYDQRRARWNVDPAGMLVKCAMAAALRTAFPSSLGGMYTSDEPAGVSMPEDTRTPQTSESVRPSVPYVPDGALPPPVDPNAEAKERLKRELFDKGQPAAD